MKRNIALYGGSFDPPHLGHVEVVKVALIKLNIDALIIVPTFRNPFKNNGIASTELRLLWLKKIFKTFKKVSISDYEILKRRAVPSFETVLHFEKNTNHLYFIIGADNISSLAQWNNFEILNKKVVWVIATRDNITLSSEKLSFLENYKIVEVNKDISSTSLRQKSNTTQLTSSISKEITKFYKMENNVIMQTQNLTNRINKISDVLDTNKGENIEVFDLKETNYFTDAVVIVTALGKRHTEALLDHLKNNLKPEEQFLGVDISDEWIVVDMGDILIHIMTSEYRNKYDMETFLSDLAKERA
jgi:nicotinate-nucleotide adenylyltransferase